MKYPTKDAVLCRKKSMTKTGAGNWFPAEGSRGRGAPGGFQGKALTEGFQGKALTEGFQGKALTEGFQGKVLTEGVS